MADRPTEARAYGAHNTAPPFVHALTTRLSLSGDGFMDPTGSLGLRGWSSPAPRWYDTISDT